MPKVPQTTRRSFLQGVAAASAATALCSSSKRAYGYQSANERPVFATIGLRNQGWGDHEQVLQVRRLCCAGRRG